MSSSSYEVRVIVDSLERASELMQILSESGFDEVSMTRSLASEDQAPSRGHAEWARSSGEFGQFNELILASLYRSGARNKAKSVSIEDIVENMRQIRGGQEILKTKGTGIVSRTVSMVASAVLGNKYGWVAYEDSEPRKYWLTEKGLEHAGIISGETAVLKTEKVP
jgi:hypothetical protein